jgi:hypothetical protein
MEFNFIYMGHSPKTGYFKMSIFKKNIFLLLLFKFYFYNSFMVLNTFQSMAEIVDKYFSRKKLFVFIAHGVDVSGHRVDTQWNTVKI